MPSYKQSVAGFFCPKASRNVYYVNNIIVSCKYNTEEQSTFEAFKTLLTQVTLRAGLDNSVGTMSTLHYVVSGVGLWSPVSCLLIPSLWKANCIITRLYNNILWKCTT